MTAEQRIAVIRERELLEIRVASIHSVLGSINRGFQQTGARISEETRSMVAELDLLARRLSAVSSGLAKRMSEA